MKLLLHHIRLPLTGLTLEFDATFDRSITGFSARPAPEKLLLDLIAGLRRPIAGKVRKFGPL
jgi:hypothetical protein